MDDHVAIPNLEDVLTEVQATIAPLWPLKDYVAVNPFVGMTERRFLEAREMLRNLREGDMLMPLSYYRQRVKDGLVSRDDLKAAWQQCRDEYPSFYADETLEQYLKELDPEPNPAKANSDRRMWTLAEALDRSNGTDWAATITNEISRHCSAHYDEGQATWLNPWKQLPMFEAWQETAMLDRRFEKLGVPGFRRFVAELPATPREAISQLLKILDISSDHLSSFLLCQLFSVSGWASYVKYRVREMAMAGQQDDDLIGLLAIRLAYDGGLASAGIAPNPQANYPTAGDEGSDCFQSEFQPSSQTLNRYWLQVAAETAYRRDLCQALINGASAPAPSTESKKVQMVFCIDVRSEVMRRHLESISNKIETFGFAGFFGLALEYLPLGASAGSPQCPVLLTPSFRIQENLRGATAESQATAIDERRTVRSQRQVWKSFQSSAASCFSFVESIGLVYLAKLVSDAFRLTRPVASGKFDGVSVTDRRRLGPIVGKCGGYGLSLEQQVELAAGMLRNLGLTQDFSRIVVICGHASGTVNNPYRAGLDCGACGGHSGESNARVAATLLNQREVRDGLLQYGIQIPEQSWFLPAVHNTTTDEIKFFDLETMPHSHANDFRELQMWVAQAGASTRAERAVRLGSPLSQSLLDRSRDWSEVRPEWGLAGNAAFVVAPRSRTSALRLDGRTFMHSYDHQLDSEWKVLELIMTAPMVVANWINLQYYASTVDNRNYGSGNKVIHNVVGQLGILEGNGGDLMTGLPWQSVHDGQKYQHEPLRLLVVIEAPREAIETIIRKHPTVRDLVCNGWLSLMAIESEQLYRYSAHANWEPWHITGQSECRSTRGTQLAGTIA